MPKSHLAFQPNSLPPRSFYIYRNLLMENSITRSILLEADAEETAPLLQPGQRIGTYSTTRKRPQPHDNAHPDNAGPASRIPLLPPPPSPSSGAQFWPRAAILCGALSLVADLGDGLTAAPEVRLLEMAVCRDYYLARNPSMVGPPPLQYVREELCKRDAIQVELAYLRALKSFFAAVPGLLCTVLFGRLADVWGRKPVLLLGMTGQILSYLWVIFVCYFHQVFPTRLVWASAIFQFMGGGHRNISALMNTVIVDVAPENSRTSTFYLVGALIRVTDIVSAAGGSWLLSHDLWLPFKISTPVLLTSLPIILSMPETLPPQPPRRHDSVVEEHSSSPDTAISTEPKRSSLFQIARTFLRRPSLPNTPLLLCLTTIFLKTFALMSNHLTLQFASKTLHWPLASAGYLLSLKAAISLLVLLLLPLLGNVASRRRLRAVALDTWVARCSLAFLAAGSWMIGGASVFDRAGGNGKTAAGMAVVGVVGGLVLGAGGNGITQTMRGLVAHFAVGVEGGDGCGEGEGGERGSTTGSRLGQLYAGIALLELVAVLTGEMAFAGLFGLGTRLARGADDAGGEGEGNGWFGLPFYVAGVTFFLGLCCAIRIPVTRSGSRRR
ncbi:major facilitator superfamily domain-containing protein [Macrophomina phaseolina]|uniref:Major facilitator superfamily domain-containing protein n=1 Tax=Macrophomina phaseolina TaxID=35725 RepID=A0ABQ8GHP9_9PEZI|nr:major facilitator superfamily domain-containing protein [Macrophomina phaseolina]